MVNLTDEACARVMHTISFEYFKLPKELRALFLKKVVESVDVLKVGE